jgi:hypothetical protein
LGDAADRLSWRVRARMSGEGAADQPCAGRSHRRAVPRQEQEVAEEATPRDLERVDQPVVPCDLRAAPAARVHSCS